MSDDTQEQNELDDYPWKDTDDALDQAEGWKSSGIFTGHEEVGIVLAAEVRRLRKLFDDAGQGEHNVLALVDHYQASAFKLDGEADAARSLMDQLSASNLRLVAERDRLAVELERTRAERDEFANSGNAAELRIVELREKIVELTPWWKDELPSLQEAAHKIHELRDQVWRLREAAQAYRCDQRNYAALDALLDKK